LSCSHCDHHDAAPLAAAPRGWTDVVPVHARDIEMLREAMGLDVDHLGTCVACHRHRTPAHTVRDAKRAVALQGSLFGGG
jgi:hypothetical protein